MLSMIRSDMPTRQFHFRPAWRWRLPLFLVLLASLVPVLYRQHVPPRWLPEYRDLGQKRPAWQEAALDQFFRMKDGKMGLRLEGTPVLLVGDSMLWLSPWEADMITVPAGTAEQVHTRFRDNIGERQYEWIVIWCTRMDFDVHKRSNEHVVAWTRTLVDATLPHAKRIMVLGPMSLIAERDPSPDKDYTHSAPERVRVLTARMQAELRSARVEVVGTQWIHDLAYREERVPELYRDIVHLSPVGFELLRERMVTYGVPLDPPA